LYHDPQQTYSMLLPFFKDQSMKENDRAVGTLTNKHKQASG